MTVNVTLFIDSVTPESPDADPAKTNGGVFDYTGTVTIEPFGFLPITNFPIHGNFALTQFPTIENNYQQKGSLDIYPPGGTNFFTDKYVIDVGIDDWVNGLCSTDILDFELPDKYHSTAPDGDLVFTKS